MSSLDAKSPIPLYYQLAEALIAQIEDGEYPVGSRIPSEPELSRRYHIGRPTVRQATDMLVQQHRVERRRGSGTYVIAAPESLDVLSLAGTMASLEKAEGASTTTIIEDLRRCRFESEGQEHPLSGTDTWFLRRLSSIEQTPVLLEALWLSVDRFPGLNTRSLAGQSLSTLASEQFGLQATSADQSFSIATASKQEADWLEVQPGEPLLRVKRHVHFPAAPHAVYSELTCSTKQFEFCQSIVVSSD